MLYSNIAVLTEDIAQRLPDAPLPLQAAVPIARSRRPGAATLR
jgi:hypothetical protein